MNMIVPGVGFRNLDAERVEDALIHLRIARRFLKAAGSRTALDKVRRAIKSTEGARRQAERRWTR